MKHGLYYCNLFELLISPIILEMLRCFLLEFSKIPPPTENLHPFQARIDNKKAFLVRRSDQATENGAVTFDPTVSQTFITSILQTPP